MAEQKITPEQRSQIAEKLDDLYAGTGAVLWLLAPHPLLDGARVCDQDGETILGLIEQLETGAFV